MARKSKLLAALDAHKGRDYEAEKRKKQLKTAEKRKRNKKAGEATLATEEDQNGDPAQEADRDDFEAFSDNEIGLNGTSDHVAIQPKDIERQQTVESPSVTDQDMSEDGAEDEGVDVALSDLSASDMEDTVPHQRLTINNAAALLTSRSRIALLRHQPKNIPPPFHLHNSLISSDLASASIPDANDDLTRETQFYAIARTAALEGRNLLKKENIPFTRPHDYFAEMVKTDIHMEKIKSKLRREASEKKGREEARRQRDARKFGKQVQVAKEQERAKEKRNTLEKIKDLKRKRKQNTSEDVREDPDTDLFGPIDVEAPGAKSRSGRERGRGDGPANVKRQKKDSKYGFGGKKRFSKSGDARSSADMSGFSARRMKGGAKAGGRGGSKRLGKSRRAATR